MLFENDLTFGPFLERGPSLAIETTPMTCTTSDSPIFGPFLDRSLLDLPADYFPDAPGVLFAGPKMLKYAGCKTGARAPSGWQRTYGPGARLRFLCPREMVGRAENMLLVRQCGDYRTNRWTIERKNTFAGELQALVFAFEHVPVWGHSRREALQLVGCCWKNPYAQ
jgi:hypothetical protein